MSKRQPRQPSLFEQKHVQLLGAVEEEMRKIFQHLHLSVSSLLEGVDIDGEGEQFTLKRHPLLDTQVNRLTAQAAKQITTVLKKAVRSTYQVSTDKAQDLVNRYLSGEDKRLTTQLLRRAEGVEAFAKQWFEKHPISERVWNITEGFKQEVEERIKADLINGTPADQISRNIREYLNEPHKRFRRVRGKDGALRLSRAAQAYHPGQGVYRSSYKNARRLAITEVNNAYRQADNDRWQQMDFVVGIRVQLSNNHTYRDHKGRLRTLVDICDDLKGDYPKDFQFTSWHPHCRCIATPILKTREEMKRDRQLIREGKSPEGSKKEVKELPENFKAWQEKNAKRIAKATKRGTLPHWYRDNQKIIERGQRRKKEDYFTTYRDYTEKNGGRMLIDKTFNADDKQKPDFYKVRTIGEQFAQRGHEVLMPNRYHYKDERYKVIYKALEGTPYYRKCPDLLIDGRPYEFEGYKKPWSKRKVGNMINHGLKQAPNIIIDNTKGCSDRYILRLLHSRLQRKNIGEVWVYEKGNIRRLK